MSDLIQLYQQMADLTAPECKNTCRVPHSCCSPEYCDLAIHIAKKNYDLDLPKTDHPKLPLMGPTGCTAPPHTRPLCALHTCDISNLGFKREDIDWTLTYFDLREKIVALEYEKNQGELA